MIGFKNIASTGGDTPINPTAPLGKIKLTDFTGSTFDDLASAIAYVEQFTDAEITETSYVDQTFYFTVPASTSFFNRSDFCSKNDDTDNLQFEDNNGLVVTFKEDAFNGNKKNNIVKNATFSISAFSGTSGNNTVENCVFQDAFNEVNAGNNSIKNCDFVNPSFRYYNGDADFIGNHEFTDFSFLDTKGNFTFQDNTVTGFGCFVGTYGNFTFGNGGTFGDETFREAFSSFSFGDNNTFGDGGSFFGSNIHNGSFGKNNTFGVNAFSSTSGNVTFNDENSFDNECFSNSTGNFKLLGNNYFQDNCFENANPTIKNEVENITSCGTDFAKNYTGRFDILSKLGVDGLQNLPNDIFTTAQIVTFNYPNALKYNNAGGKDGDLVKALENISNLKSVINAIINYSTDEIDTGAKWIDGKPIYRKVVVLNFLSTGSLYDYEINHNLSIDKYIDVKVISEIMESTISTVSLGSFFIGQSSFSLLANAQIYTLENKIYFEVLDVLNVGEYFFIIEYTKTTD